MENYNFHFNVFLLLWYKISFWRFYFCIFGWGQTLITNNVANCLFRVPNFTVKTRNESKCDIVFTKVYRLGGETDTAIRWRKKNFVWRRREARGSWLRTFLKLSLKMPSIFCEFLCYNRKLCVNKPIIFFHITLA